MKHFKTVLAQKLKASFAKAKLLEKYPNRFASLDDVEEYISRERESRRKFIVNTAKFGAALYIGANLSASCRRTNSADNDKAASVDKSASIAIVGGGIAGLNAAHILKKAGFISTVYEASGRTGGRIFTGYDQMGSGLTTELGGEYIDSDHEDMLELAREFGLELYDLQSPVNAGLKGDAFFIDGRFYSEKEIIEAFRKAVPKIEADAAMVTDEIGYDAASQDEINLDNMSIAAYLEKLDVPKWFKKIIDVAYTSEMGVEIGNQSALNFITFISTETDSFKIFGDSDERYKIRGGNSELITRIVQSLGDQIKSEHALEALLPQGNAYLLKFQNGVEVKADFVILALPFTRLREVDIQVEMPDYKKKAIRELAYGTNSKLMLGFEKRIWREQGFSGYLFNNLIQNGWDNSIMQTNNEGPGGYTFFLGGEAGKNLALSEKDKFLAGLDKVFPGAAKLHTKDKQAVFNWPSYGYTKGSYSAYAPGQWTSISGAEVEPVGNIFFAGEHCSWDYQGYMNGGAETGRKAAEEILTVLKTKATTQ